MGYDLEVRLAPTERPGQLDLSVVANVQIVFELPSDRVVVLNLQELPHLSHKPLPNFTLLSRDTLGSDCSASKTFSGCRNSLSAIPSIS